ncbi:aspartate aminotransferase family protein [Aurantibacillus circumpalustris]|uniref:aspartate aminotransferase family protein n=1 Tax=Aurantibacillus circumpalustris TaxID=3036359 RepID=UPI00295B7599|nr:aspartate aminotransferase family protein [Aurantibacillus circumpalustris]
MNQRELFLRHVAQTSDLPLLGVDVNIQSANGSILKDVNGKEYIDLISGISVSNIGHCHPKVISAINEQSQKYMHLMVYGEFNQSPQVKYATALSKLLPEQLSTVYFTTSGSEAVEGALKLAKRVTGRTELISFRNAYHGSSHGALSVMGDEYFKSSFRPLLPDVKVLEFNNIKALESITSRTAAVIVEPIQGEAGIRKANHEFLKTLREKCTELCVILIFDEIQCGFGRTGTLFAFEQFDVVPDVLLIAKGMGGGLPIGAFISSPSLMSTLTNNPVLGHINTFGGNAVCVAAAQATIEVIVEEKLFLRAKEIEDLVLKNLQHPLIKEIRMHGALGAIDFGNETVNFKVIKGCIENGVISDWFLFCSTAMRIAPPLTITDKELLTALETLKKVLDAVS